MFTEDAKSIVETELRDEVLILRIKGRLNAITASELDLVVSEWIRKGVKKLLLNFSEVPYLSSAGLRLLLLTTIKLKSCKGKLVVCSLSEEVTDVMNITGFNSAFDIYKSEEEGFKGLRN